MPPLPNSPPNRLHPDKRELTFAVAAAANGLPERSDKSLGSLSVTAATSTQQTTAARIRRIALVLMMATELLINCQLGAADLISKSLENVSCNLNCGSVNRSEMKFPFFWCVICQRFAVAIVRTRTKRSDRIGSFLLFLCTEPNFRFWFHRAVNQCFRTVYNTCM